MYIMFSVIALLLLTIIKASKSSSVKLTPENARLSKGHNLRTYPVVSTSTISNGICNQRVEMYLLISFDTGNGTRTTIQRCIVNKYI